MGRSGSWRGLSIAALIAGVLAAQSVAAAQVTPPINVGDAAPVPERQGLLGTYYRFTGATPPGSPPGSPATPNSTTSTLLGAQLETIMDRNFETTVGTNPILAGNKDMFMVVYEGRVVIATAGDYTFYTSTDDGERTWIGNTTTVAPTYGNWVQRANTEDASPVIPLVVGMTDVRIDYEQGNGGAIFQFRWMGPGIAKAIVPTASLRPPPGPVAPTLNASSPPGPAPAQVTLTWNQPAGATGYIVSRDGQVLAVLNAGAPTQYVDNAVTFNTTYDYIVQATSNSTVSIGPASNTASATPTLPPITVAPTTGLQTNENASSTNVTITFNQAVTTSVTFTVQSNDAGEGVVSSSGQGPAGNIMFTINGPQPMGTTVQLTLTGVDDLIDDGNTPYTVSITTAGEFGAVAIPDLQATNNDNDAAGITFSQTAGLVTSENATTATFDVTLNTQPTANVTMTLTSSDTLEATVSPATLTFTATSGQPYDPGTGVGGWDVPHVVTVTGVDDAVLDFTIPFTILTGALGGADPTYASGAVVTPDVTGQNLDNEVVPAPPGVWGNCGLVGLELLLPLGLLALRRRKRGV